MARRMVVALTIDGADDWDAEVLGEAIALEVAGSNLVADGRDTAIIDDVEVVEA